MDSIQKQQDIQQQLQALRGSFAAQLPERIADIEQGWKVLLSATPPEADLYELYRKLHSLAGSAGTFGMPELGQQARRVELRLKAKLDAPQDWSEPEQAEIETGIGRLRRLVEENTVLPAETLESPAGTAAVTADNTQADNLVYLLEEDVSRSARMHNKLVHFGYRVETFYDRGELMAALQKQRPMALIMDFHTREVQAACTDWLIDYQRDQVEELPVIFIANDLSFEVRLQAVRAGGFAYLDQPVDIVALVEHLNAVGAQRESEPYRVVVVDDDLHLAQHYALVLSQAGIESRVVDQPARLLDTLIEFRPDVMLMDLYMPECNGRELARLVRQDVSHVSMPIVFLSAERDQKKQFSALMNGGDDFITKPVADLRLVAVVESRAQRARALEHAMSRDSLTGLLKHTKIKEAFELELARAHRHDAGLSYAMVDIDHFKFVNDTYGHAVGDRVIKSLAHLLMQRLRQTDIVGRYGGEEFVVVLPDTDSEGAAAVMEEVRKAFSDIEFDTEAGSFSVTLSVGLVSCGNCGEAETIAEQADQAMYEAKRTGRNRMVCVEL
ncbi:MAG: diguanylate cyclase [Gammaproteobacteria bacterium]|nr:diguanylate cyclase [Gammaproteobacteria bacterium]